MCEKKLMDLFMPGLPWPNQTSYAIEDESLMLYVLLCVMKYQLLNIKPISAGLLPSRELVQYSSRKSDQVGIQLSIQLILG
jgi:hypothetical protein